MNHLAGAGSPYLLQHAHNPVDWYPWGEEALQKAKAENKLLIISIGYAACHWCHVMEHESFADEEVAALMNEHYVSIKVDREERPDIDAVYMEAVMLMTRRGGWPLNCIALPDGRPIYGGTYFPKANWKDLLSQIAKLWKHEPAKAIEYATDLTEALQQEEQEQTAAGLNFNRDDLSRLMRNWLQRMDRLEGGEQKEPKFPMPVNWQFLLRASALSGDKEMEAQVLLTLKKIALGGIYDHAGGGFARYSTDALWHVPHFEKMLYDNAQLVSLYTEAWLWKRDPLFETTVKETLAFLNRELRDPGGAYYASLDADSEGEEGKFYVWEWDEFIESAGKHGALLAEYFAVSPRGNWEHGKNVLIAPVGAEAFAAKKGMDPAEWNAILIQAKADLLAARSKKIRPALDDKVIASWNGLMMRALAEAGMAFNVSRYIEEGLQVWNFIRSQMMDEGKLKRSWRMGKAHIHAFLDDYALVAEGLIALFKATGDMALLDSARELCEFTLKHFSDAESPLLFYTSDTDAALITRKKEVNDNVIAAANSVMAHNLYQLGIYFDEAGYQQRALQMLTRVSPGLQQYPGAYGNWASLALNYVYPVYETVVAGPDALKLAHEVFRAFVPNQVLLPAVTDLDLPLVKGRWKADETRIFICREKTCRLPVNTVSEALEQLH